MPIRWDTLMTRHVASELERSLAGARLRAVRLDRSTRDLTLVLKDQTVIWRLHPTRGYVLLHAPVEPAQEDHRVKGRLERVEAPPDERLIRFDFAARSVRISCVVELMGAQWNAVVTEGEDDLVRHLLWRPKGDERRVTGQRYRPPPPTERLGVRDEVSLEQWLGALEPLPASERRRVLVRRFAWTSPLNASALVGAGSEVAADLTKGFGLWRSLVDPATPPDPVVLELESGAQPYPFPLAGISARGADSLLAALATCAEADGNASDTSPAAILGPELLERVEGLVRRAARRLTRLETELATLADPQELRGIGDLILARYRDIPVNAERATLTGFDGEPVEVRLGPGEPAHANAARYYGSAAKAERAAQRLPRLVDESKRELERLESLLERASAGTADEGEVREALGPAPSGGAARDAGPSLPYRTFRTSGGLEARVGRGARFNDDLTFHHSSPGDVWLHARHTAGAHVILRWQGSERPPARDLEEAAILAALHSKARTSGSVPVDWTFRKYVRKPRKSPPGQVLVEREETLFVEPDATLLERLEVRPGAT